MRIENIFSVRIFFVFWIIGRFDVVTGRDLSLPRIAEKHIKNKRK